MIFQHDIHFMNIHDMINMLIL